MQTSLSRRQRRRRLHDKRRPRGSGAARYLAVALPLILFTTIALIGFAGATGAVAAYSYLSRDLPDPKQALETINYDQQTGVYDRTGEVLLARLGSDRRELVTFDQIPAELVDATTAIEDDSFWQNPGFDLGSFLQATWDTLQGNERGGSTITQQLVRNRLLLPSDVEPGADKYQRKLREIIQSIRLTEAYPGEDGKKLIIQSYMNNNYYGNRSYGVAAAAQSYWSKNLADLSLAQYALLAGIPKSPSAYDLVQNAVEEDCTGADGKTTTCLVVPPTTAVVQRRNEILEFMKTRSPLSGTRYTAADYEAAKAEPVVLASQSTQAWRAPHFVWKVRDELGQLLCGESQCEKIDTGGYTVITSLDYRMQRIVEKWVYAAAIIPNSNNQNQLLKNRQIPRSEWDWIKGLSGHNLHNAAAGVVDYRTGEILAYAGSASYTAKGSKKMQPQFDVLGDGWRQPGSSFKPLVYVIGIDDGTLTASTMFMDVVTNFAPAGAKAYTPTQADKAERGPVLLRSALQFSLNVPAVKAGFLNGLDHQFQRTKDFGIRYPGTAVAVPSMSIGTLEVHPIDLISAFGAIADEGVLMPRHTIVRVLDDTGAQVWPPEGLKIEGERVVSRQAAYIVTDILAGNTRSNVNPFWARWKVTDGVTSSTYRPAAYKTGTTSDNRDVLAVGYLAQPSDEDQPALVAGVWMGNSDNTPNDGKLSLDTSAPLWSAIMSDVSKGMKIEGFARTRPKGLVTATVDAFTGMKPSGGGRTIEELFIPGTEPTKSASYSRAVDIDSASGLLWREGCVGPMVTKSFVDYSSAESGFKTWQRADAAWQARAARGAGVTGGPERTYTAYFYGSGYGIAWFPFGRSWGGAFAPTKKCPIGPPPPTECVSTDPLSPCPTLPPEPTPTQNPGNGGGAPGKPTPTPKP